MTELVTAANGREARMNRVWIVTMASTLTLTLACVKAKDPQYKQEQGQKQPATSQDTIPRDQLQGPPEEAEGVAIDTGIQPDQQSRIIIDGGSQGPGAGVDNSRNQSEIGGGTGIQYKPLNFTVTEQKIQEWVDQDKSKRGGAAEEYRYAYIPIEYLNDPKLANYARIGLSKALNSVAIDADEIHSPEEASENYGVVYAIPIAKYWGDKAQQKWNITARAQSKRVFSPAPRLDLRPFDANAPVNAARLAYNLMHGGVYNQLIETPPRGAQLTRQIAGEVTHRMGVRKAITYGPRYAQRRELKDRPGSYWEAFDEFYGRPGELMWINNRNPIPRFRRDGMVADYGTVASEAWQHMKNGMIAYYIFGNVNQERTRAELSFVRDPLNPKSGHVITGFCAFCHITGVQAAPNDMWKAIEEGRITGDAAERARQFWTDNKLIAEQYNEDRLIFQTAMQKIVLGISDGDKEWNEAVIAGADPREPIYTLVNHITGLRNGGDTTGMRTREQLERRQQNNNQNQNRRGGFGLQ